MALNLSELIPNYLKYMKNIESCSDLTTKAYTLDLKQAYFDKNKNQFILKELNFDEFWNHTRTSLNQWSKLSLASRNRKVATLKSFFNWLYQESYIEKNYAHQLICPKIPKKIPDFLSVDEVTSVLKFYSNRELTFLELQEKNLFIILYGGGLRISEACNLRWKDLDFHYRKALIKGKGNKERILIFPEFCIDNLKNLKQRQKKEFGHSLEFVFGSKPLNPRAGYEMIRSAGAKAGLLNRIHPHSLRHSFATHLLASGANLRTLQTLLGHESLRATEKYTHLNIDALARTMESSHPLSKLKVD